MFSRKQLTVKNIIFELLLIIAISCRAQRSMKVVETHVETQDLASLRSTHLCVSRLSYKPLLWITPGSLHEQHPNVDSEK